MIDLTPDYNLIPSKEKVTLEEELNTRVGGMSANSSVFSRGSGDDVFKVTSKGVYLGAAEFEDAPFSVDMQGNVVAETLVTTQIDIPNTTTANSFHVDTDGNAWWGATELGSAIASVSNTGAAIFTNMTLTGLQAGSEINGEYIDALSVGKLSAGTISSKAISLGVTAGTGDCYISGGTNLDYTNWVADKGFILGLDDSDSDLAKFFIGDDANDKYFKFDGTNTDATGFRYIETFTTGENIVAGNVVCLKPGYTDYYPSQDGYIDEGSPDTVFDDTEYLYCDQVGASNRQALIEWDLSSLPTASNIIRAEIILTQYSTGSGNITIYGTSTDWTSSTVTWNTKPTSTLDIKNTYFSDNNATGSGGLATFTYDVTQLVRLWKSGVLTNEGIMAQDITTNTVRIYSGYSTVADARKPTLRIYSNYTTSPTLYKAIDSDYLLCRSIPGIAIESITAGNMCKVQILGQVVITCTGGSPIYLSTSAGAITESSINANRLIMLGKSTKENTLLLDIQQQDRFIEKPFTTLSLSCNGVGNAIKFIAPNDARYVRIVIGYTRFGANYRKEFKIYRGVLENYGILYDGNNALWTVTWESSTGLITMYTNNDTDFLYNFYFYT